MEQTKTCTKCGETKPLVEFHKAKYKPLGVSSQCKQCRKEWYLDDYKNNPDKYAKKTKQWRDNNRDSVRMIRKKYEKTSPVRKAYLAREDVKQRRREIVSAFHARNPEARSGYSRKYRQRHDDGRFARYKAKYRENNGTGYINQLCVQGTVLSAKDLPPVITNMKRAQLQILRATKQLKKIIKEI